MEKLASRDVARVAGLSAEHFCRAFKQVTGLRFTDYVARLRVEKASKLLRSTSHDISHVALLCGFHSIAQFNRTFRRVTQQTPTAVRQQE
jgi:transcriptional regulator GlxA family with amidase domain